MTKSSRLCDIGEFRFLAEVVAPALGLEAAAPEDAAVLVRTPRDIVITADRGNRPVAFLLGEDDWQVYGWLLVTSTVSDLAAVGAKPVAFSSSIELPSEFQIDHAKEFFAGIRSACKRFDMSLAGGNVAQGAVFSAHGFAVGEVQSGSAIRRVGCTPGDALVLIGDGGLFMSAFLTVDLQGWHALTPDQHRSLMRPIPKVSVMQSLRERGLVRAASDDSDGVLGAIWNVVSASGVAGEILADKIEWPLHVQQAAKLAGVDQRAIFFAWGDWQVVAAVNSQDVADVETICRAHNVGMFEIGRAVDGPPHLTWISHGKSQAVTIVRNEAFTSSAYRGTGRASLWEYVGTPFFAWDQ